MRGVVGQFNLAGPLAITLSGLIFVCLLVPLSVDRGSYRALGWAALAETIMNQKECERGLAVGTAGILDDNGHTGQLALCLYAWPVAVWMFSQRY